MDKKTIKPEEPTIGTQTLSQYVTLTIEQESQTLRELIDLVTDSITIKLNGGQICSDSKLSSTELELLAMKIPSECLRIQTALNRYTGENVFRDIAIEARVTQSITDMIGQKGCADERKRKAELLVLDERATSAANKAIVRGLQGYIDRADKVYEGIKKGHGFPAPRGGVGFDRKICINPDGNILCKTILVHGIH